MLSRWFLVASLFVSVSLPSAANAQLCADTAPLAFDSSLAGESLSVASDPTSSRVVSLQANTAYELDATSLGILDDTSLSDDGIAIRFDRVSPEETAFITQTDGYVEAYAQENATSWLVSWTRRLSRAGCPLDTLARGPAAHHPRAIATPSFVGTFGDDLLYVGTSFVQHSSQSYPACTGTYNADNRVYALEASSGDIAWVFNLMEGSDVDQIAGMALDPQADRLYVASERTYASDQPSLRALDVLSGTEVWSADAGRIQVAPVLHGGRLYIATVAGEIKALDPATGSEYWSFPGGVPFTAGAELTLWDLANGDTLIASVDLFGQLRVVRDDGPSGDAVAWFRLPDGAAGMVGAPSVQATSRIVTDESGTGLVSADDGKVYPVDLVTGTVGTPVAVDAVTESVPHLVLEPPGAFASPASFLVATSGGVIARYCTTVGAPPAVPALGPWALGALASALLAVGASQFTRR